MKKWSLNAKVIFVIAILAVGATVISYTGIHSMSEINDNLKEIVERDMKRVQLSTMISESQRLMSINLRDMIIESNSGKMKKFESGYNASKEDLLKYIAEYRAIASEQGQVLADQYKQNAEKLFAANQKVLMLAVENKKDDLAAFRESTVGPMLNDLREILEKINALTSQRLQNSVVISQSNFENARFLMLIISVVSISSSLLLAFLVLRVVTKAIDQVIANLTDNSNQVTSAAQQIASSSEELSQAATEQASSLEETASSIEEMNSMVQKNAENAKRTSELSHSSHESAEKGKTVVQNMIRAIDEISDSNTKIMNQIDESNHNISEIVKVIAEIGNKTKVINDIVFQTKLLSFNASVEAARAGEHGKGFAVVAEEVGNLAQMSGNAAKEISSMLDGSIQKVDSIVNETKQKVEHLIQNGKSKVEIGISIAKNCGDVLNEIVSNVANVTQMANEISTACQEQAQGVQEITRAMNQLDQVTQTNAATSEEAASAAEELSSQSESLRSTVGILVQEVKGASGEAQAKTYTRKKVFEKEFAPNVLKIDLPKHKVHSASPKLKKVSGWESSVPSENDSRFEEV